MRRHLIPTALFCLALAALSQWMALPVVADADEAAVEAVTAAPVQPGELALGDDDCAEAVTAAPVTPEPVAPEPEEVATSVFAIFDSWKSGGALAGILAFINCLLLGLRIPLINDALTKAKAKWLKPLIAVVLGAGVAGIGSAIDGSPVGLAILAGVIAALGSVGFHQLLEQTSTRGKTA